MSAGARCKETVRRNKRDMRHYSYFSSPADPRVRMSSWALRNRCQCRVCVSSLSTGTTGRSEELKQGSIQDLYSVQCLQFNRCCNRDRLGAAGWATAVTNIQLKSWNNTTVSSRYRPLYILQLRNFFFVCFFYDEPFPFLMKRLPLTISLKEEAWAEKEVGSHR